LWSVLNKPELQRFGDDPDFPEVPRAPLICNDFFADTFADESFGTRDRFYETRFRPKIFWTNLCPVIYMYVCM
jgi:hypothetical protein